MGKVDGISDDEIVALYEEIRAAEKNPALHYPFGDREETVSVEWDRLERRALAPSLPERVRAVFLSISVRALSFSIVLPVLGMLATFFWLRDVPVEPSRSFFLNVVVAAAVMVLMFMWASVAVQAMDRLPWSPVPQPVYGQMTPSSPPPQRAVSGRSFQPVRLIGTHRLANTLAFCSTTAVVVIVVFGFARSAARHATGETLAKISLKEAASDYWLTNNVKSGGEQINKALAAAPRDRSERDTYFKAADLVYQKLMSLSSSDPQAAEQRDTLADQALTALDRAQKADPGRAAIWTRLAEVYFLKGDLPSAKEAVAHVQTQGDSAPPQERIRAQIIAGYISAYDVSKSLPNPKPDERPKLADKIDQTIRDVEKTTEGTDADASALLTHLHLVRAAVAKNDAEQRKSEDKAISSSLAALRLPEASLRAVDRPMSLSNEKTWASPRKETNAHEGQVIPTGTRPQS